jgi:hypothetical protein
LSLAAGVACSGKGLGFGDDPSASNGGDDAGGFNAFGSSGSASSGQMFTNTADGSFPGSGDPGPCKGGHYVGTFAGQYWSHIALGLPLRVTGNVDMHLNQAGTAGQQCEVKGEFEQCNNVFTLKDGTITGVADKIGGSSNGGGGVGGFPYYCTMMGTLDCKAKTLVDGWIECTYCVGDLADGGEACVNGNGFAGTYGTGGKFAGPLTANYDYKTLAFVGGTWNGAEALVTPSGVYSGPDSGQISQYISDSGTYGAADAASQFGGSGTWTAAWTAK